MSPYKFILPPVFDGAKACIIRCKTQKPTVEDWRHGAKIQLAPVLAEFGEDANKLSKEIFGVWKYPNLSVERQFILLDKLRGGIRIVNVEAII